MAAERGHEGGSDEAPARSLATRGVVALEALAGPPPGAHSPLDLAGVSKSGVTDRVHGPADVVPHVRIRVAAHEMGPHPCCRLPR